MSPEEETLLRKAVDRDAVAFGELYRLNSDRVYRYLLSRLRDAPDAEDLTAQTFLQAWRAIDRYKMRGSPFISWLLRIAHNLVVSQWRRNKPATSLFETEEELQANVNVESVALHRVELEEVLQAVEKCLSKTQRLALLLRAQDVDYETIARLLGGTVSGARVLKHRGLQRLRDELEDGAA